MYEASVSNEYLGQLPVTSFDGEVVLVNDLEAAAKAANYLLAEKVLGFDTETRPNFSKGRRNHVALLQLAGADKAFLFRLSNIGLPRSIVEILENEYIVKVGAAIKDDITALGRLSRFTAKGFIDLQKYVEQFSILDKSVKKMAAIVLNVRISKSQQLSNWESEVYTNAQMQYAATDAWICREIYSVLKQQKKQSTSCQQA